MFRTVAALLALWCAFLSSAGANTSSDIAVRSVSGAVVKPLHADDRKATVLLFIAHDCPVSNSYAPEINRICKQYTSHKVGFYVVYVEADLTAAEARKHVHDYGYVCPALLDPQHRLVTLAGATVTPEAAVFAPDGRRIYLGRIDNQYADIGRRREVVTAHDLRDALDRIVLGKPVAMKETTAIGCFIPTAR